MSSDDTFDRCDYAKSSDKMALMAIHLLGRGVDSEWYRSTYPDIGMLDPIEHYSRHGWREGRSPNADFSVEWYRKAYPELCADVDPFTHYLREGRAKGHRCAPHDYHKPEAWTCDHGGVDPVFYRKHYNYDDSRVDAAAHYTALGWREGRDPNCFFSTQWYLSKNFDIAEAGIDPLHHYLTSGMAEGRSPRPTIFEAIRFHEWWYYKFSSLITIAYATAIMLGLSIFSIWPLLLVILAALSCAASYVSLINDWCDRSVDACGGKANRLSGRSLKTVAALVATCVVLGGGFAWYWRHDPLVLALYLGTWVVFSLYSFPPVRLKYRGLLGPLADATGAHVCPTLLLTVLVFRWANAPVDWIWFTLAGSWALGFGLRGIFFHQKVDIVHDAKAGMQTFVGSWGTAKVQRLENAMILPFEITALSALLFRSGSSIAILLFVVSVMAEIAHAQLKTKSADVPGDASHHPMLFGCYQIHQPLALLLVSALIDGRVVLVAVVHAAFFFRHRMLRNVLSVVWSCLQFARNKRSSFQAWRQSTVRG